MAIKTSVEIKEGYMGGFAFTGCNYKGYMRYSEINKIVKKEFKAKFPNVKVSCTGSSFSGGQSCDGKIIVNLNDAIYSLDEVREKIEDYYKEHKYCFQVAHFLNDWDIKNYYNNVECDRYNTSYENQIEVLYNKYINYYKGGSHMNNGLNEFETLLLKPEVIEMVNYLNALYDSFNDCDNNGMVDYFSNMFYKDVELKLVD